MPLLKDTLTPQEIVVARLIATGMRNAEIALKCGLTKTTISMHTANIFKKTGMTNRTQIALRWVKENG